MSEFLWHSQWVCRIEIFFHFYFFVNEKLLHKFALPLSRSYHWIAATKSPRRHCNEISDKMKRKRKNINRTAYIHISVQLKVFLLALTFTSPTFDLPLGELPTFRCKDTSNYNSATTTKNPIKCHALSMCFDVTKQRGDEITRTIRSTGLCRLRTKRKI